MGSNTAVIRSLNDQLRRDFASGMAFMTPGVAALGAEAAERILKAIAIYKDFCNANDPWSEGDFGQFKAEGQTIFFKIDYYDRTLTMGSPDPADPTVTTRVLTIMLASDV